MKVQLAALAASYVQVTRAVADLQKKITLVSTQSSAPAASALPKCSTPTSFLPPTKKRKTSKPKTKGSFPQPRTPQKIPPSPAPTQLDAELHFSVAMDIWESISASDFASRQWEGATAPLRSELNTTNTVQTRKTTSLLNPTGRRRPNTLL